MRSAHKVYAVRRKLYGLDIREMASSGPVRVHERLNMVSSDLTN